MSTRILLGVSGGIAAYKACSLVRLLREAGHDVRVVPTASALKFVGAPTWEALSGHPVAHDVWSDVASVGHVERGRWADLVIIAPATADLLARAAAGMADDLLTTSLLTATCPVVMCPAMHSEMWLHPATQANVRTLAERGTHILPPAVGRLTGPDSGPGRLPEPQDIMDFALARLAESDSVVRQDLAGRSVVVSAGGTREPLDPVRFLGNRSSGRQGVAIAQQARDRGATVTLVAANLEVSAPDGIEVVAVDTAESLRQAMLALAHRAEVLIMAAAVADFRPREVAPAKIKKTDTSADAPKIELERTPDVLAELVAQRRPRQIIVGFAAETGDERGSVLDHGRTKLAAKGCDLLVVNDVGGGRVFGQSTNEAVILSASGTEHPVPLGSKEALADTLLDIVAALEDETR